MQPLRTLLVAKGVHGNVRAVPGVKYSPDNGSQKNSRTMHIKKHLLLVLLIVGPIVSQFSLLGKLFGADMTQVQNNIQKNDVGVDNTMNLRAEVEAEKKMNQLKEEYRREAWSELKFWVSFVLSGALLIMTLCLAWSCKGALMKKLKRHNAQPVLPMEQFAIL